MDIFRREEKQFSRPLPQPRKLLDHVRDVLRVNHYSARTEEAYVGWIRRYILYHNKTHPREMGALEVELYLTHLAVGEKVSTNIQKQALIWFFSTTGCFKNRWADFVISSGRSGRSVGHWC